MLFCSEAWPVCLHEKVIVQLSPLDQQPFHPPDVFLLVITSAAASFPREATTTSCWTIARSKPPLLLCSISSNGLHVGQRKDSEIALCFLVSMAWLKSVNREQEQQGERRLERCLLSAHGDVFRVPWEDLIYPQFITLPHAPKVRKDSSGKDGDVAINTSAVPCRTQLVKPLPFSKKSDQSPKSSEEENSEGDYVELTELTLPSFSPQQGSLTQSISKQVKVKTSTHAPQNIPAVKHTSEPTKTHISGVRHSPWSYSIINSQTSVSPPAPSEEWGVGSCQEKSCMVVKETGDRDSDCTEQQKDYMKEEPVNEKDTVGRQKESDGEEMDEDEVVEVEEEVQIIIQQNQERTQEDEPMKEDEKKAGVQREEGSQDIDSHTSMCSDSSYCEKNGEPTESVDSYSEKEKTVLGAPSPGTETGFKSQQEVEKTEGADEKGATEFKSEGTFSPSRSFTSPL